MVFIYIRESSKYKKFQKQARSIRAASDCYPFHDPVAQHVTSQPYCGYDLVVTTHSHASVLLLVSSWNVHYS
jgi:hypothetical protein